MSDKQLTVAELLARSGGKEGRSETPRRRRRRSLEEGGISVAELTGNIPKVDAKPVESKHSNAPIDEEHADRTDEHRQSAQQASHGHHERPEVAEPPQPQAAEREARPQAAPQASVADREAQEPTSEELRSWTKYSPNSSEAGAGTAASADVDNADAAEASAPKNTGRGGGAAATGAASAAATDAAAAAQGPSHDETIVLSVVDERDPVRLTTGGFPAQKPAPSRESAPREDFAAQHPRTDEVEAQPQAEQRRAEAFQRPSEGDTGMIPQVRGGRSGRPAAAAAGAGFGAAGAAAAAGAAGSEADHRDDHEHGHHEAHEAQRAGASSFEGEHSEDSWDDAPAAYEGGEAVEDFEEESSMSVASVVFMAIVGIVLGVAVFIGFQMLWGSLNRIIVGALALAVTGGMVAVIHAMRTERDKLSMALAAVVGLVVTFGPMLTA